MNTPALLILWVACGGLSLWCAADGNSGPWFELWAYRITCIVLSVASFTCLAMAIGRIAA